MTQGIKTGRELRADKRRARLAAELRANLKKRKAQARGRVEAERPANNNAGDDSHGREEAGKP